MSCDALPDQSGIAPAASPEAVPARRVGLLSGLTSVLGRWFAVQNTDRAVRVTAGLLAVLFLGVLATPLFQGRVTSHGDMGDLNLPLRAFYARCLRQGDAFDWMPQVYSGAYLAGEGNLVSYHPLTWLLYRCLPLAVALELDVLLPYVAMFLGMVWFLRLYVSRPSAWVGALFFAFSLKYVAHLQHPPFPSTMAHLPWLLVAIHAVLCAADAGRRRWAGLGFCLLTGSQFLFGFPQGLWFSLITEGVFALFLLVNRQTTLRGWATLVLGGGIGLLMGAVKFLATYSFIAESTRGAADASFAHQFPLDPCTFAGLLAPCLQFGRVTSWGGIYMGSVPLLLMAWWLTAGMWQAPPPEAAETPEKRRQLRRLSGLLLVFGLLMLWLAVGYHGRLYHYHTLLPVVGKFRCPERFHLLTTFCVAVLGALAFARLLATARTGRPLAWWGLFAPWAVAAGSIGLALYFWFSGQAPAGTRPHFPGALYTGPAVFVGVAVAITLAARGRRAGIGLLLALLAVDVGLFCLVTPAVKPYWRKAPTFNEYLATIQGPPDQERGRVHDLGLRANALWLHGYRLNCGYIGGMAPLRHLDYRDVSALRVAEVRWFRDPWTPTPVAGLEGPIAGWWRVPDPLPRARLLSQVQSSANPRDDLKSLDVDHCALLPHAVDLPAAQPGVATIVNDRPGRIAVNVTCPARQLLTVSETYNSGWTVSIDGQAAGVERVNADFIGCLVEGGKHQVEFAFAPPMLRFGRWISLAALAAALVWGAVCLGAHAARRPGESAAP